MDLWIGQNVSNIIFLIIFSKDQEISLFLNVEWQEAVSTFAVVFLTGLM